MSAESKSSPEVAARVGLLRFLSRVFLREIDGEFLAVLRQPDILEILGRAEPGVGELLGREWGEQDFENQAVEFCRLFVAPGVCRQLASAWVEKSDGGDNDVASVIQALIQSQQLSLSGELNALPRDHISVSLELAAWLCEEGEGSAADEFLSSVALPWATSFAATVVRSTESVMYRAAGRLLIGLAGSSS